MNSSYIPTQLDLYRSNILRTTQQSQCANISDALITWEQANTLAQDTCTSCLFSPRLASYQFNKYPMPQLTKADREAGYLLVNTGLE